MDTDDKIIFNIYYNKKKNPIAHQNGESIINPLKTFSNIQKKKLEDFAFLYKGSLIYYKDERIKDINNLFFSNAEKKIYNIFAILLESKEKKNDLAQKTKEESSSEQNRIQIQNQSQTKKQDSEEKFINFEEFQKKRYYNDVICPECETSAIIDINEDKENIYGISNLSFNINNCENFHYLKNINFNAYDEFYNKYQDDKCNLCSIKKLQLTPPNNELFLCSCGIKVCPECKIIHNESGHNKIDFEKKNYYCINHNKKFFSYCVDCNANFCEDCEELHKSQSHECYEYKTLKPRTEDIKDFWEKIEKQKTNLKKFMDYYKKLFEDMITKVESYLSSYVLIEELLIKRYKENLLNFQLLRNLNNQKIFNISLYDKILKRQDKLKNEDEKFSHLYKIYSTIIKNTKNENKNKTLKNPEKNKIILNYKINETNSINKNIKLFDPIFVKNNKDKLFVEINKENQKELSVYFHNKNNLQNLNVVLIENTKNRVTDLSYMLNNCKNLESVDFSNFNTTNIQSMEAMFQMCPLIQLPDSIIKFSSPDLVNIRAMFCKCLKLETIPELTNLFNKTNKIENISMLFNGCIKVQKIVSFEKWNAPSVKDMSYLFNRCKEIKDINFGKFNSVNINNMCGLFNCCEKLKTITQMKFETNNVEDMSLMFQGCESLEKIDEIHRFHTQNVKDMSGMFSKCHSLTSLPKLSGWTLSNVREIVGLFNECQNLTSIDLGKWNMPLIKDASGMFYKCSNLKEVKGIKNWKLKDGVIIDNIFDQCSLPNTDDIKKAWTGKK